MGGALDAVLQLKAQEQQADQFRSQQIASAAGLLQNAMQNAQANKLAQMQAGLQQSQFANSLQQQQFENKRQTASDLLANKQYSAGLAEKGLKQNQDGTFTFDPSTLNPVSQIMLGIKGQADAKTAGNKPMYDMFGKILGTATGNPQANGAIGQIIGGQPTVPGATLDQSTNVPGVSGPATMTPTGQTSSTDPITGLTTGTTTMTNIPGKVEENKATDIGKAQADAEVGSARDTAQMQMVAQGLKNLNGIHKELSDKGYAGNSAANFLINNYQHIPNNDLQNKIVPPDVQKLAGKFISARNEALVKVQPILSQQFGSAGTNRIMESLVNLSKGEFGDLSTPHSQFEGQAEGTLGSLFRIKLASDKYLEGLKKAGQPIPNDEKAVTQGIYANMADLTPDQNKQLNSLVSSTLGKNNQEAPAPFKVGESYNGEKIKSVKRIK